MALEIIEITLLGVKNLKIIEIVIVFEAEARGVLEMLFGLKQCMRKM